MNQSDQFRSDDATDVMRTIIHTRLMTKHLNTMKQWTNQNRTH